VRFIILALLKHLAAAIAKALRAADSESIDEAPKLESVINNDILMHAEWEVISEWDWVKILDKSLCLCYCREPSPSHCFSAYKAEHSRCTN
jgi:hypothetical protein